MALTNQQVQQVFLAITGRPAEGSAVAWGANSLSVAALANSVVDIRKGADFTNSKEAFVENLYTQLLGRPSDAEGKEFWLKALNDGASYGDVLAQFINAVLVQPSSADLYTLQNKLSIAEQISTQVNTFQGGAAAEATLKDLMSTVNANTTYANIEAGVNEFIGQNVNIANVTVQQGAEEATKGSDDNATIFNATLDLSKDGSISIDDAGTFADTLNLTVKGVKDENDELTSIGDVAGIKTLNITTTNIKTSNLDSSSVGDAKSVTFNGSSEDTFTADSAMTLLDTGAGVDTIILNAKVATVKAGSGNDNITVNTTAAGVSMNIDGGTGTDSISLTTTAAADATNETFDYSKLTLSNIETISGGANGSGGSGDSIALLASAQLNNKKFTIADGSVIGTKAASGANFSKITVEETGSAKLYINDVKSGTVSLTSTDIAITEDTTLLKTAKNVKVNNFAATDKLHINDISAADAKAMSENVAADAIFLTTSDAKIVSNGKLTAEAVALFTGTKTLTAGNSIYLAEATAGSNKTLLYKVTNTNGTEISAGDKVELMATIDAELVVGSFN